MPDFRYTINPQFRDILGRFTEANDQLVDDYRDVMRSEGRRFKTIAQGEAPQKTGKFASGIRFRSFQRGGFAAGEGGTMGFTVSTPQPLGRWIIKGTRPHIIRGNPYLSFYWPKVGRRVVFRFVNHPGTKPNDFMDRTYAKWRPGMDAKVRGMARKWKAEVSKAG